MVVISLDPGVTTGYAVLDLDRGRLELGDLPFEDLEEKLRYLKETYPEASVVAEVVVDSYRNRELRPLGVTISKVFEQVDWLTPGEWKNSFVANIYNPDVDNKHQRDALCIGAYYLWRKSGRKKCKTILDAIMVN